MHVLGGINAVTVQIKATTFGHYKSRTQLLIANREIKEEKFIKYLGLHFGSHLSWKFCILHISKKKH